MTNSGQEPAARGVAQPSFTPASSRFRAAIEVPRSDLLDEENRPHLPTTDSGTPTPAGRASQRTLLQVHEHLRQELAEMQSIAQAVAEGRLDPAAARSTVNRMTLRQNFWTLGTFCAQYCRVVTIHHTIEDTHMFPALRGEDEHLSAILDRLGEEHVVIAEAVERLDRALVQMMTDPPAVETVRRVAKGLGDALLSHLAYEEDELLGPLGRSSIAV